MSLKRQYPFPYKTVANDNSLDVSSISIENITIQSPSTYPTYTLTLPVNAGSAGQVLTTNGSGVLSWAAPTAGVTSVTASSPVVSSGGATPNISLNTVPTTLGGTGLTTVGTNGQVLTSDGTNLSWQSPTGGTVTSVSASVPSWLSVTVTNPTTTPAIAISGSSTGTGDVVLNNNPYIFTPYIRQYLAVDVLTTYSGALGKFMRESANPLVNGENYRYIELGRYSSDVMFGSDSAKFFFYRNSNTYEQFAGIRYSDKMFRFNGLANFTLPDSEGTNGQILSTDGTGVTSWINNAVGTVTSVSASVPSWLSVTVTNPTTTPAIAITGSATGTGTVSVLQDSPTINNTLTVTDKIAITRNNGNGEAISILNSHSTFPVGNWVSVGYNGNSANQAHFGFWSLSVGSGYAYIETNGNQNFVVDNNGRIGVGTTAPSTTIDVSASQATIRLTSVIGNATQMILRDSSSTDVARITTNLTSSSDTYPRAFQIYRGTGAIVSDYLFSANNQNQVVIGNVISNSTAKFEVLSVTTSSDVLVAGFFALNSSSRVRIDIAKTIGVANSSGFLYYDVGTTGIIGLGHTGSGGKLLQFDNTGLLTVDKVKTGSTTIFGAGAYTITLPPTAGTNGQVLTTDGSGTLSWTTPTTGTVTSVSATSPLASSGGATPTISISSSTGTGAVMLANYPIALGLISDNSLFTRSTANDTYVVTSAAAGSFGYIESTDLTTAIKRPLNLNPYGGNVGIGTTAPSVKFHVVNGSGDTGIFEASTNYGCMVKWVATATNGRTWKLQSTAIGDGEHPAGAFVIDDGTANVRRFVINGAGNISIGVTTAISSFKLAVAGAGYFNNDGENLVLDGPTHSYLRWRVGSNNYGYMGYSNIGSKDITLYNQRTDGHIILDVANTAGAIRCVKNIFLQETVYIQIAPGSATYSFILPSSAGTTGQVLTSAGAGNPLYWSAGGGGGGGTVTNVTATSPLGVTSGTTTPNISITSSTGTGAVVLANNPTVTSDFHVSQTSTFGNNVGIEVVRSGDPTPANNVAWYQYIPTASADYSFYNTSIGNMVTFKVNGNVGIGTTSPGTKLEVSGDGPLLTLSGTASGRFDFNIGGALATRIGCLYAGDPGFYFVQKRNGPFEFYHDGTSGQYTNFYMPITARNSITVSKPTPAPPAAVNAEMLILAGTAGTTGITTNTSTLNFGVVGGGGGTVWSSIQYKYGSDYGFYHEHSSDALVAKSPIYSIDSANPTTVLSRMNSTGGNTGLELRAISGISYIDMTAKSTSGAADYDFRISKGNDNDVNFLNALGGSFIFNSGLRATNFSTDGVSSFTYTESNFTPRLGAYRRPTNSLYELGTLPTATITATYSTQTGRSVKVGKMLTINIELRWTISTSGLAPDDYDICIILPDAFNSPNGMATTGACLNYPNVITGISNPMGILLQYPTKNGGGNVSAVFPVTNNNTIAYPIFAPGATQILQFSFNYVTTS